MTHYSYKYTYKTDNSLLDKPYFLWKKKKNGKKKKKMEKKGYLLQLMKRWLMSVFSVSGSNHNH